MFMLSKNKWGVDLFSYKSFYNLYLFNNNISAITVFKS